MELNRRQSQFELFPSTSENLPGSKSTGYQFKDLTLSLENIIVLCIILVMALVLSFSFGVENGKNFYRAKEMNEGSTRIAQVQDDQNKLQSISQTRTAVTAPVSAAKVAVQPVKTGVQTSEKLPASDNVKTAENPNGLSDQPKPLPQRNLQEELIGRYTIQVASFKQKDLAIKEAQKLTSKGHKIFVIPKGSHSIVCIGNFGQKKEAEKILNKFKNKYGDSLVRRF